MKKPTFIKVIVSLVAMFLVIGTQAQLRNVQLYCNDDWTIDEGHKDAGIEWGNNLTNNDEGDGAFGINGNGYQEAWLKWDLSSIELSEGEEILSAEVMLRTAGNYTIQGFEAIVLDDKYDEWVESDFNWNKAKVLGDFMTDGGDTVAVVQVAQGHLSFVLGEDLVNEKFSLLSSTKEELAGNKKLTMRMKPYITEFDEVNKDNKEWVGYYSRQAHSTWEQKDTTDANGIKINAYAPYLKMMVAVPAEQFSTDDMEYGNINNYNTTPENSWYAIKDAEGEGRLLMLKNNSQNPDSIGSMAIYKNKADYGDFKLTLDARSNDALSEMKTNVSIIFDYVDASNYSCFTFYGVPESGSDKLNGVYNVVDNIRNAVGTSLGGIAIGDDEYHTYSVEREGSVITASIDGEVFHVVDDARLAGKSGSLGYGSGKYIINFDNVKERGTISGIINAKQVGTLSIFPNPAANTITVNTNDLITSIKILDIVGKTILNIENVNSMSSAVDVSNLTKGVYIVIAESNGLLSSNKVIIK